MSVIVSIFIPIFTAFLGAWLGSIYHAFVLNRQEKAILVLLVQEFMLLLKRTKMYYGQMINGGISFSALFEASDPSTLVKLAEVSKNSEVIKKVIRLKADFFRL